MFGVLKLLSSFKVPVWGLLATAVFFAGGMAVQHYLLVKAQQDNVTLQKSASTLAMGLKDNLRASGALAAQLVANANICARLLADRDRIDAIIPMPPAKNTSPLTNTPASGGRTEMPASIAPAYNAPEAGEPSDLISIEQSAEVIDFINGRLHGR
jgi:hypothetical protein